MNAFKETLIRIGNRLLMGATLLFLCILLASCDDDNDQNDVDVANTNFSASEDFYYSFPAENRTGIFLSAISGPVSISGEADLDSVVIAGERRVESESVADAEDHLNLLSVVVEPDLNDVSIRTEQPQQSHGRSYVVEYNVRLPMAWHVKINQVNGTVDIESVRGGVNAEVVNGSLQLWEIMGDTRGNVTNGSVNCRMTLLPAGSCEFGTVNGSINLLIPTSTSAALSANVLNGTIAITGLTLYNSVITPRHVSGTLGDGNGVISLATTNGSITISGF